MRNFRISNKLFCFLFFILYIIATPIVHVVLTNKIFDKFFADKNKQEFFIGTCLPDIRYLKVIDRSKTHFEQVKLASLDHENSFSAGLKFHSILDKVREDYIVQNNTYDSYPDSKHIKLALKILEEQILYSRVKNWDEFIKYLDNILPEEMLLGVHETHVKKWHSLLQENFSQQPDKKSTQKFASALYFPKQDIENLNKLVKKLESNKKIVAIVQSLYKNFGSLIEEYKSMSLI